MMTQNPKIVFEGPEYLIIDKPALFDCQNSKNNRPSLVQWLEQNFQFAGLVHRLDFGTSGLLVCAKNSKSASFLTQLLQSGQIQRYYQAVCLGQISPDQTHITTTIDGQNAHSELKLIRHFPNASLLEITLHTGRKHQIRRHLSDAGFPLLGDHLYGKKGAKLLCHRPALHAFRLSIQANTYTSPLPEDFNKLLKSL